MSLPPGKLRCCSGLCSGPRVLQKDSGDTFHCCGSSDGSSLTDPHGSASQQPVPKHLPLHTLPPPCYFSSLSSAPFPTLSQLSICYCNSLFPIFSSFPSYSRHSLLVSASPLRFPLCCCCCFGGLLCFVPLDFCAETSRGCELGGWSTEKEAVALPEI